MAQLCTATFIKEDWFATGLSPTVEIVEALTWTVKGTFPMEEINTWNYIYNYVDGSDQVLYFFNFDANDEDVINRYQGNNNRIEVSRWGGGWTVVRNNVINSDIINRIANKVIELLPENKVDLSKIEETLGSIVTKINESDEEFDYDTILSSIDENTLKIINKVNWIKIPECKHTNIIKSIDRLWKKIDKIEKEDISEIKQHTIKIKTKNEQKQEDIMEVNEAEKELLDSMEEIVLNNIEDTAELEDLVNNIDD